MTAVLLDRWRWEPTGKGTGAWGPPTGCQGAVDLASLALLESSPAGQPRGWGVFVCREVPPDLGDTGGIVLASEDVREARPDGNLLDGWEKLTGYRPQGDSLVDLVWDQLTRGSDPANLDRCAPLVPTAERRLELWLGDLGLVRAEPFAWGIHPHTEKLADLLQRELEAAKVAAQAGKLINPVTGAVDAEYHLRIADALTEKYAGIDPQAKEDFFTQLRPTEWSVDEELRPHATTVSDNFNRSNQSGLGTSSEGWSWSPVSGTLQIVSNQAKFGSGDPVSRADSDLSSADHFTQIERIDTIAGSTSYVGPCCRFSPSASTYYLAIIRSSGNPGIYKRVAGSFTRLNLGTAEAAANTYRITANGTTISQSINGAVDVSVTDSSITGMLRTGLQIGAINCIGDNFLAGDLTAGVLYPRLERNVRGYARGVGLGMR